MLVSTLVPAGTTFSSFWYKYQLEGVMFRGRTSGGGLPPRGAGAGAGAAHGHEEKAKKPEEEVVEAEFEEVK